MPRTERDKKKRPLKRQGIIFVISAPSGTGKTTLSRKLVSSRLELKRSVSVTTRTPRKGELDGRDYVFVTPREFKNLQQKGELLEWARIFDNFYGTPRQYVEERRHQGEDILLSLDVQGAMQVKKKIPDAILIFVAPPSIEDLRKRLMRRHTDNLQEIEKRLKVARRELLYLKRYNYALVNNDIREAVAHLRSIITAERLRVR